VSGNIGVVNVKPKGPGKRGHIVADTLLLMMFLGSANALQTRWTQNECCVSTLRKLGNICCGQNQKHFLCPGHKIKKNPATNAARAGKFLGEGPSYEKDGSGFRG